MELPPHPPLPPSCNHVGSWKLTEEICQLSRLQHFVYIANNDPKQMCVCVCVCPVSAALLNV